MLNVRTLEASGLMGEYHCTETYWTKSYWIFVLLHICWHCFRLGGSSHSAGGGGDEGLRSHMTSALGGLLTRALNNFLDKNRSQPSPPVTQVPRYEYMPSGTYKDLELITEWWNPWRQVLLEKLIATDLFKKWFTSSYMTGKFITICTRAHWHTCTLFLWDIF